MTSAFVAELATGDGFVVLTLSGELDLAEAPTLRKTLDRVVRTSPPLVVIDATELQFIDSTGIGVLVGAHNQLGSVNSLLVVANLDEKVGRPLRLTEVDTAIPVHLATAAAQPWAATDATPVSILSSLGLTAEAAVFSATPDAEANPVT